MQVAEARPPYVTFEAVAVEDRAASIEAGYYKTRDVDFAFITPQGSKDRIERNVKDWFEQLEQQCQQGHCGDDDVFPAGEFQPREQHGGMRWQHQSNAFIACVPLFAGS